MHLSIAKHVDVEAESQYVSPDFGLLLRYAALEYGGELMTSWTDGVEYFSAIMHASEIDKKIMERDGLEYFMAPQSMMDKRQECIYECEALNQEDYELFQHLVMTLYRWSAEQKIAHTPRP